MGHGATNRAPPHEGPPRIGSNESGGTITSLGFNLIGVGDGCPSFNHPTDLVGTAAAPLDPRLLPLFGNGGPTETHKPLANSPVVSLVPVADCTCDYDADPGTPEVPLLQDQRGYLRPRGDGCESGAFESSLPGICGLGGEVPFVLLGIEWLRTRRRRAFAY